MDPKLMDAAKSGNVNELRSLMKEDPFLLKSAELSGGENSLHIACKGGHVDFVKEIVFHNPEFAEELNAEGLSPLHIASGYGYLEIVQELLHKVGSHLCLVKAKNSKTALHYAVIQDQIPVIDELLSSSLPSIKEVTDNGETCFHMAVKHQRVEALEHLTRHVESVSRSLSVRDARYVLNKRDKQGNTILHLAASRNLQDKFLGHLLLTVAPYLECNALNRQGLTPLNVFVDEGGRKEMEDRFIAAGAKQTSNFRARWRKIVDYGNTIIKKKQTMSNETRNTLLVVLALIIASTYQAVINPPGGLWQDTVVLHTNEGTRYRMPFHDRSRSNSSDVPHLAGTSIFRTLDPVGFTFFFIFNSLGFMISCALSLHLIAPNEVVIWLALFPMFVTYAISAGVVVTNRKSGIIIAVGAVVIASVATSLSVLYSKLNNAFKIGRHFYQIVHSGRFKTQAIARDAQAAQELLTNITVAAA